MTTLAPSLRIGALKTSPASVNLRKPLRISRFTVQSSLNASSSSSPQQQPSGLIRVTAFATTLVNNMFTGFKHSIAETIKQTNEAEINSQIKQSVKHMRMLAIIAPFAAVSGSADTFYIITKAVASFIKLYLLLLFVRVLLSWFPTFTWWEQQPWLALRQVTDPYLKLFSGLVPPLLGTIDLTPLFGFFILQFLAGALDVADEETQFWS